MATMLDSTDDQHAQQPRIHGYQQCTLGNSGAAKVAVILPTTKPITPSTRACCKIIPAMVRFLSADQFQHGTLADLVHCQGVDDEGHDGCAGQRPESPETYRSALADVAISLPTKISSICARP